jgi:hypothetical protein
MDALEIITRGAKLEYQLSGTSLNVINDAFSRSGEISIWALPDVTVFCCHNGIHAWIDGNCTSDRRSSNSPHKE